MTKHKPISLIVGKGTTTPDNSRIYPTAMGAVEGSCAFPPEVLRWAAVVGFVTTVLVALGVGELQLEQIIAIITAAATLIAYIIGEGMVDAARVSPLSHADGATAPPKEGATSAFGEDVETVEAEGANHDGK